MNNDMNKDAIAFDIDGNAIIPPGAEGAAVSDFPAPWQNADDLPESMDRPCELCGCAITGCLWVSQDGYAVVCSENHVHVLHALGFTHPCGDYIGLFCSTYTGTVAA